MNTANVLEFMSERLYLHCNKNVFHSHLWMSTHKVVVVVVAVVVVVVL